jgi:hypothetical protein
MLEQRNSYHGIQEVEKKVIQEEDREIYDHQKVPTPPPHTLYFTYSK